MSTLVVITGPELASGFRLAGVEVLEVQGAEEAHKLLIPLMEKGGSGILAVSEEYLEALDEDMRNRVRQGYRPLVIGLPSGRRVQPEERRSHRIAELIQRAIGFRLALTAETEAEADQEASREQERNRGG